MEREVIGGSLDSTHTQDWVDEVLGTPSLQNDMISVVSMTEFSVGANASFAAGGSAPVPEPSTLIVVVGLLFGFTLFRRKQESTP